MQLSISEFNDHPIMKVAVSGVSTLNPEKGTLSEEGGEASPDEQT